MKRKLDEIELEQEINLVEKAIRLEEKQKNSLLQHFENAQSILIYLFLMRKQKISCQPNLPSLPKPIIEIISYFLFEPLFLDFAYLIHQQLSQIIVISTHIRKMKERESTYLGIVFENGEQEFDVLEKSLIMIGKKQSKARLLKAVIIKYQENIIQAKKTDFERRKSNHLE